MCAHLVFRDIFPFMFDSPGWINIRIGSFGSLSSFYPNKLFFGFALKQKLWKLCENRNFAGIQKLIVKWIQEIYFSVLFGHCSQLLVSEYLAGTHHGDFSKEQKKKTVFQIWRVKGKHKSILMFILTDIINEQYKMKKINSVSISNIFQFK